MPRNSPVDISVRFCSGHQLPEDLPTVRVHGLDGEYAVVRPVGRDNPIREEDSGKLVIYLNGGTDLYTKNFFHLDGGEVYQGSNVLVFRRAVYAALKEQARSPTDKKRNFRVSVPDHFPSASRVSRGLILRGRQRFVNSRGRGKA